MQSSEKITLYDLNLKVKEALSNSFSNQYWVIAEISEIKENNSGHCYLELIQKDEEQDYPKAKARATIWAYTYRMLKPYFETSTGRPLSSGLKVLVQVEVVFHEVFGYSLNITDIEPSFTLGDIEQKRRETIEKLISEGVFDMNKSTSFPIVPKRVAVISSTTAAGLQDFINQINTNKFGYKIECTLFSANMQGNTAEESIIAALNGINDKYEQFDVVVIIRGGGSQADLSCFDGYWLSAHVAQFPIPIITGIGHDKDVSVVDLVAHTKLKTPTAVAEFIISKYQDAESIAFELAERLEQAVNDIVLTNQTKFEKILTSIIPFVFQSLSIERLHLERIQNKNSIASKSLLSNLTTNLANSLKSFEFVTHLAIKDSQGELKQVSETLINKANHFFESQIIHIQGIETSATILNPENILKRGYSITTLNGKIIRNPSEIEKGTKIKTKLFNGEIESITT